MTICFLNFSYSSWFNPKLIYTSLHSFDPKWNALAQPIFLFHGYFIFQQPDPIRLNYWQVQAIKYEIGKDEIPYNFNRMHHL